MDVANQTVPAQFDHGQRRQAIVRSVLTDVFGGRLCAGQRLVTQELADRFGVSPTPIREALVELAAIDVIDLLPNRGAVVRRVTRQEVRDICQVRRALECEATRSACGRIDLERLDELAGDLRLLAGAKTTKAAKFIERARKLDSRFHDLVAESCGNAFLAKELNRLKTLFRAFRDISYQQHEARNDYRRLANEAREHLAVVEALLAGQRREAVRAMARHIWTGVKYWTRALPEANQEQEATNGKPNGRSK